MSGARMRSPSARNLWFTSRLTGVEITVSRPTGRILQAKSSSAAWGDTGISWWPRPRTRVRKAGGSSSTAARARPELFPYRTKYKYTIWHSMLYTKVWS